MDQSRGQSRGIAEGEARGKAEGKTEGKTEGIAEGEARGKTESMEKVAKAMLAWKVSSISKIAKVDGSFRERDYQAQISRLIRT